MNISRGVECVLFVILLAPSLVGAAPEQQSSGISACGSLHTNTTLSTVCEVAQPGTVGVSANGRFTHYSGFIGGAFIRPTTTNRDGVALEADPDNDNDGLTDAAEVSGAAFGGYATTDLNAADTDHDGMTDAAEAAGMYDPNDPEHSLCIIALTNGPGGMTLRWIGKGGDTANTVLWGDDVMSGPPSNVLHAATFAGGVSPWFKVTNSHTWAESAATSRFFRVMTE